MRQRQWKLWQITGLVGLSSLVATLVTFWVMGGRIVFETPVSLEQKLAQVANHCLAESKLWTEDDLEEVYRAAAVGVKHDKDEDEPAEQFGLAVLQGWITQYCAGDLEAYLKGTMASLPEELRALCLNRLEHKQLPRLRLLFEPSIAGSTNRHSYINLNPAVFKSYDDLRHTLSHELTHYYIQGVGVADDVGLCEGMTELTVYRTYQAMEWDLVVIDEPPLAADIEEVDFQDWIESVNTFLGGAKSYDTEATVAGLLVALDDQDLLLSWYCGQGPEFTSGNQIAKQVLASKAVPEGIGLRLLEGLAVNEEELAFSRELVRLSTDLIEMAGRESQASSDILAALHSALRVGPSLKLSSVKKLDSTLAVIEANLYEPLSRDEWNRLVAEKWLVPDEKDLGEMDVFWSNDQLLACLDRASYGSLPLEIDDEAEPVKMILALCTEELDRRKVVRIVCHQLRTIERMEGARALNAVFHEERVKLQEAAFAHASRSMDFQKESDELIAQAAGIMREQTRQHWELIKFLDQAGFDMPALMKERGVPTFFQGRVTEALEKLRQ